MDVPASLLIRPTEPTPWSTTINLLRRLPRVVSEPVPGRFVRRLALAALVIYVALAIVLVIRWSGAATDGALSTRGVSGAIEHVIPGSPAERAGLRPGDRIVSWNGIPAATAAFADARYHTPAGTAVTLIVATRDDGAVVTKSISLALVRRLELPEELGDLVLQLIATALAATIGIALALAAPRDPAARLLFVGTLALAFVGVIFRQGRFDQPAPAWRQESMLLLAVIAHTALLHLFLMLPHPHPLLGWLRRHPRSLARAGGGIFLVYLAMVLAALALMPSLVAAPWDLLAPQLSGRGYYDLWALSLVPLALGLSLLFAALLQAPRGTKALIGLLFLALLLRTIGLAWGLRLFAFYSGGLPVLNDDIAVSVTSLIFWGLLAAAIVRHRLFELEPAVATAVGAPLIAAALITLYDLATTVTGRLANELVAPGLAASPLVGGVPALVVAAAFQPVRKVVQHAIDRAVQPRRVARRELLQEAIARLTEPRTLDEVRDLLTRRVVDRLELGAAWLFSVPHEAPRLFVTAEDTDGARALRPEERSTGPLATAEILVPLRAQRLHGVWVLTAHRSGRGLDPEDLALISYIGRMAALHLR